MPLGSVALQLSAGRTITLHAEREQKTETQRSQCDSGVTPKLETPGQQQQQPRSKNVNGETPSCSFLAGTLVTFRHRFIHLV